MKKIVIDLIVINSCNKICEYCPIKFNWWKITKDKVDFVINYLEKNKKFYEECTINFFGWEPLLNFEVIKYFVEKNKNKKIKYTIWTNWFLLTEKIIDFLLKYNINVYLTFHADDTKSYFKLLEKEFLKKALDIIQINFIVSPNNLDFCYKKIDDVINFWFKVINIIPVMLTIPWRKNDLINLKKFINYVDNNYLNKVDWLKIYKFSYFDWVPVEIGFVINYNLDIYQDSSDELYIWKQFDWLWHSLIEEIERVSYLWNIMDNNLDYFVKKYDIKKIVKALYSLPKKLWYLNDYMIIYKIMNSDKNNRSCMGGNIYKVLGAS